MAAVVDVQCKGNIKKIISCKNSAQRTASLLEIMDKRVDKHFVVLHYCVCVLIGEKISGLVRGKEC